MSWGRLPWGLRERPFDVYAAFLLLVIGIYSLFNDIVFFNDLNNTLRILVAIVSIYFICSSTVILASLLKSPRKCPAFVLFGEMYGWLFVSAAAVATFILILGNPIYSGRPESWFVWSSWLVVWGMLSLASALRSFDLISKYRKIKK
jgi:hypothetical protein